ncbi:hypothetical protein I6F35_21475 [Bradyrhizobium sp. BRP22]|uniref:calcium-binding protein n=1 Tax=Bradyrhizobium sp. BRP22 TaxID=2793821 RepID=UPI001CD53690|nr:hypothetical protein [Bradyrhizobium sp. BRP22]MCA1455752.1 hypothetical protein [Bradyrhizobium sp. BRP22]
MRITVIASEAIHLSACGSIDRFVAALLASRKDCLAATTGNDTISGRDDADKITVGDGNDHVWGGKGKDALLGGNGNDYLKGGDGSDVLNGDARPFVCTAATACLFAR